MADSTAAAVHFPRIVLGEVPVMAGKGDEIAAGAGGRGHLRASHADREQVIGMLKAAFVQGRLAKDELDMRVGQALASRTYADLAALTADLPAGLARTQPVRKPARAKARPTAIVKARPTAIVAVILCPAGIYASAGVVHAVLIGNERLLIALMPVFISFVVWMVAGIVNWRDKRSGGQSPRRPASGAGGQGSRRLPSADLGGQRPPADPGHQQTAQAAPIRGLRHLLLPGWRPQATTG
jgi:DUF1707 SHOCT-like domain